MRPLQSASGLAPRPAGSHAPIATEPSSRNHRTGRNAGCHARFRLKGHGFAYSHVHPYRWRMGVRADVVQLDVMIRANHEIICQTRKQQGSQRPPHCQCLYRSQLRPGAACCSRPSQFAATANHMQDMRSRIGKARSPLLDLLNIPPSALILLDRQRTFQTLPAALPPCDALIAFS